MKLRFVEGPSWAWPGCRRPLEDQPCRCRRSHLLPLRDALRRGILWRNRCRL
jgi:hypothetical protein